MLHDTQVIYMYNFFYKFDNLFESITKIRISNNSFEFEPQSVKTSLNDEVVKFELIVHT